MLELDADSISAHSALADLGADSLVRVETAELVEQALDSRVRISDEALDGAPTVADLAAAFLSTTAMPTGGNG